MYPFWKEKLKQIHPNPFYSPYRQIFVSGAARSGKTTMVLISILYELCCFLHRKDPHLQFGFTKNQPLFIALCNATIALSNDTQLDTFQSMFNGSPFFREQQAKAKLDPNMKLSKKEFALNLPFNLRLVAGSQARALVGKNILNAHISEVNQQKGEGGKQAINTYVELANRIKQTFDVRGKGLQPPGKLYLDSSTKEVLGIMDDYMKTLRSDKQTLIIEEPLWVVFKGSHKDHTSGEMFKVFIGDEATDPFIISEDDNIDELSPVHILDVPVEYQSDFKMDCVNALRDVGGIAVSSATAFIHSVAAIDASLSLPKGTTKDVIKLDMVDTGDKLINYVLPNALVKGVPYFVHFDLSKTRARTGIAFTRVAGSAEVPRMDRSDGKSKIYQDNAFKTDLLLALEPKPNSEIPLYKFESFMLDMKHAGYTIGGVSFDQYQSVDLQQRLTNLGFKVEQISVDNDRRPYDQLRQVIYEKRWQGPNDDILRKELKQLQDNGRKIEKPPDTPLNKTRELRPSKDLSDAVCGSLWNCALNTGGHTSFLALEQYVQSKVEAPPQDTLKSQFDKAWKEHKRYKRPGSGWFS